MTMFKMLNKLRRDERGISAVEYAILIGVVGVALVGVLSTGSESISTYVTKQITSLNTATDAANAPAPAPGG